MPALVHAHAAVTVALALAAAAVHAQPAPAAPAAQIPMGDYLGLLEQIAPAARTGAEAYITAHRVRCGRSLSSDDLRSAMAHGSGDPVLMAMIRAAELRDSKAIVALEQGLQCGSRR